MNDKISSQSIGRKGREGEEIGRFMDSIEGATEGECAVMRWSVEVVGM